MLFPVDCGAGPPAVLNSPFTSTISIREFRAQCLVKPISADNDCSTTHPKNLDTQCLDKGEIKGAYHQLMIAAAYIVR